jgi:type I restriction enzyme S subunit
MQVSKYPLQKLNKYSSIEPGFAFKSEKFTDNPEDLPLVKGENLQQGYIDWKSAKRWPSPDSHRYNRYWLNRFDIVVAMDRPWVTAGLKWSYIKPHEPIALLVQRVARLRAKKGLNQHYLRYLIGSEYCLGQVR